jgi:hypothetical protein
MGQPIMLGQKGSFYLPYFVKKFTYWGSAKTSLFADKLSDILMKSCSGVGLNNHRGRMIVGVWPSSVSYGSAQQIQNVDRRGVVFRDPRMASLVMPGRLGSDRPDPQLPIEEDLYGKVAWVG